VLIAIIVVMVQYRRMINEEEILNFGFSRVSRLCRADASRDPGAACRFL